MWDSNNMFGFLLFIENFGKVMYLYWLMAIKLVFGQVTVFLNHLKNLRVCLGKFFIAKGHQAF
jgi:hypothetical protein